MSNYLMKEKDERKAIENTCKRHSIALAGRIQWNSKKSRCVFHHEVIKSNNNLISRTCMELLEYRDCRVDFDSDNIRRDVANFVLFHFMMIGADSHG